MIAAYAATPSQMTNDSFAMGGKSARRLGALKWLWVPVAAWGTMAQGQTQKVMVDVVGSAGYASSPFLVDGESTSSVTFELSVTPRYTLADELGQIAVEANYRRIQYLRLYDETDSYGLRANANRQLSEKLSGNVNAFFESSILGEQGARQFIGAPLPSVDGVTPAPLPEFTGPGLIVPDLIVDVGLIGLRQRQNQLGASAGLGYALTERDQISGQVNFNKLTYGGGQLLGDFRSYGVTLSYARALSAVTQLGARGSIQKVDYDLSGSSNTIYQPQLTLNTRFSPLWDLSAAAGLLFVKMRTPLGASSSTGFSGNVAANRRGERTSLSLRAFRDASASGFGGVSKVIGASLDHRLQLNETDGVQWGVSYSNSRQNELLSRSGSYSFAAANVSYDRRLTDRLNGGVSVGYRDTFGGFGGRPADFTAQLFIRARIGDLR